MLHGFQTSWEKNGIISHLLSSCVWAVTAGKLNFKEHPMRILKVDLWPFQSLFLFSQSLKTSNGVRLIEYVNTARNKDILVCLRGGSQIWLQVSEDVGQHGASYSACSFVHALGFFFLLVLILNNIPAIEGRIKRIHFSL